jgi:tripartite-type tricarboxylate transporter receptor subunit TctC
MNKLAAVFCACFCLASGAAFAQGGGKSGVKFPTKPITLICPWTAGGGTDTVLRALGASLEKQLGVTVNVENRTGGGGTIGHMAIKNAKPDGYTVGMVTWELSEYKKQGVAEITYADYDLLSRVNMDAAAITVKADAPYNSLKEWIDYAKANPGKINIGNSAPLSVWHVAAALVANQTGIEVKHVPFEGAAPAVTALAGGHIQAVSVSLPEVKGQLDAGNVKVLGLMDNERSKMYPNIPTLKEQGVDVVFGTWRGMALPKGVDPAVKDILAKALKAAQEDPAFIATAAKFNLKLAYQGPEDFTAFLKQDLMDVSKTIDDTHLLDQ